MAADDVGEFCAVCMLRSAIGDGADPGGELRSFESSAESGFVQRIRGQVRCNAEEGWVDHEANFVPKRAFAMCGKADSGSTSLETLDSLSVRVGSVKFENLNKLLAQNR